MYPEERMYYEMALGTPGQVDAEVEALHERVSALVHKVHPGQLALQTMAVIAALADVRKNQEVKRGKSKHGPVQSGRPS